MTDRQCHGLLWEGVGFCFETVCSRPSKMERLARAKALADESILVLLHLKTLALQQGQRLPAERRGHDVSAETVIHPLPRPLHNVRASLHLDHVPGPAWARMLLKPWAGNGALRALFSRPPPRPQG